ncbi:MAG TPA: MFS transporter [Burkholderiales bacterium]|nr:MFS transporter [Burkholderiales bacterium]
MRLPHSLRAFRHRDYRLYFFGQGTSQIGTWLQLIATSWLVYKLSGSAFLLGLASFALQIPFLVLAPFGGVLVDRLVKRRVLYATQGIALAQSLVMFALVATGHVQPWHLVAGNLVLGIVNAFDSPARQSFLVELVGGREDLPNAIAMSSALMNGARFIGPMIGGVVIASAGVVWGFGLNSVSYLAMLAALAAMRAHPSLAAPRSESWASELLAGFRYTFGFLPTRSALLLLAAVSFCAQPYQSLMPWFAKEVFHGNSETLGMLIGAGGFGAVAGMLYLASRPSVRGLLRLLPLSAALAGLSLACFAFAHALWLALPLVFLTGMGIMLTAAATNTVLQTIVEDRLRARVASLYIMSFLGASPLGALLAGTLSHYLAPPLTLALGGLCAALAAAFYASKMPAIRREIRPLYQRLGILGPPPAQ